MRRRTGGYGMADERTRQEIEAETARLKATIQEPLEDLREYGYLVGHWADAPLAHHPVWGDEWQALIVSERRWGIETGPPTTYETDARWDTMARWAAEDFAARQAAGEIPAYFMRGSWEAYVIREATEPVALRGDGVPQTPPLPVAALTPRDRIRATMAAAAQRVPAVVQEQESITYGR
jgi:hypothetical protein